jgi:protein phosphatase
VVVLAKDEAAATSRFGVPRGGLGACFTRTGRPFFGQPALEAAFLEHVRAAAERAGLWGDLGSDWMVLDAELMPWSAKAQALIKSQYAAVAAAGGSALGAAAAALEAAGAVPGLDDLRARTLERKAALARYGAAYRRYCWDVGGLDDLRLAPFHLLASEGSVHVGRDHVWHMEVARRLAEGSGSLVVATPHLVVDVTREESLAEGARWWEELTERGGEGMVVKPLSFVAKGRRGMAQPAVKCRGREYLRIIYGPEYTLPENLERLRSRGLAAKQSLARREFALGVEALERFVRREPLRRVHECVFGVLALESEPVDPRL